MIEDLRAASDQQHETVMTLPEEVALKPLTLDVFGPRRRTYGGATTEDGLISVSPQPCLSNLIDPL